MKNRPNENGDPEMSEGVVKKIPLLINRSW